MPACKTTATVEVAVLDSEGQALKSARVVVRDARGREVTARRDRATGLFRAAEVAPGNAVIAVTSSRLEAQKREVELQAGEVQETFVLGREGLPFFMRGTVKVPFEPRPGLVGVTLRRRDRLVDRDAEIGSLTDELGLEPVPLAEALEQVDARLYRLPADDRDAERKFLAALAQHPEVAAAGSLVGLRETSLSFLTSDLMVRFATHVTEDEVRRLAKELELEILRSVPYSPNTFHLRWGEPATLDLLALAARLQHRDDVVWAEPNLMTPVGGDAIHPPDFLWPGEWERKLVRTPEAWQLLSDAGLEPFGDPDMILAVVDHGIESNMGVPAHPDFQGTVSNGADKVYKLFDFRTPLVPNNDNPPSNHGMGVAGISTAMAGNPAAAAGQTEGLAGAAPNCRVMGLICPGGDVEVADAYIWAAGFDPHSPAAGFPAPIGPGADIFTCSIGFGEGAPLSGIARAMLDFVTTFGRGGKGCLCFFSTGNWGMDIAPTHRPYAAYEKSIAIAATRLADDGVTEQRIATSGWGDNIQLSAPSNDEIGPAGVIHNPPLRYGTWAADLMGQGDLIGHVTHQTTLTASAAAGATSVMVGSVSGLAFGARLLLGLPGSPGCEAVMVTGTPNPMTGLVPVDPLLNHHVPGTVAMTGPANYTNRFGGTSSATPLAAGVAALVLSAEPELTWIEARQILRDSAVKLDPANTNAIAQWLDAAGNPSVTSGNPPLRSRGYGYGRVDAEAAVQAALTYGFTRDLVVRENLADSGAVPSTGAYWNSPDIWVRNVSPVAEGGAALPPTYASAPPHQHALAGQPNWIYARVRNNGTAPSLDCYVRISLTHYPGLEFTYPDSFVPTTRPGDPVPSPLVPGTYLVGEVKLTGIAAGDDEIVSVQWPANLVPPENVSVGGTSVKWHPCLLVEVSPHDGPAVTGTHVWDNNNLAQKNITVVYTDAPSDFAMAMVAGHEPNLSDYLLLEVDRGYLPREVQLYVDLVDPILKRRLRRGLAAEEVPPKPQPNGERLGQRDGRDPIAGALALVAPARPHVATLLPWPPPELSPRPSRLTIGHHDGREVAFLPPRGKALVPIYAGAGTLSPIVIGGIVGPKATPGEYSISLVQRDPQGRVTGSAELAVTVR